jgi:malonyl CoA-acyl carrier protein transacylase
VFLGRGRPGKVAFLYTGQGSQYVNMLKDLRAQEPVVADTFAQADRVMTPMLGRPLTEFIFIDGDDGEAVARLEQQLLQTEITQPAVLATDIALTRLLATHGITPDIVMGHSLGEYGALVAAGALSFAAALEAVSARGSEMAHISVEDNGAMAAVLAPLDEIERVVDAVDGYVVIANVNSPSQAVIGGATAAVEAAIEAFGDAGHTAIRLPVSHAFHTSIVAPASEPLRQALLRLHLTSPTLPIVANVDGELYPMGPDVQDRMLDILSRQVASPVQFVKGLDTLYAEGARVFVEVGPKKALHGFVEDALGQQHDDVVSLFTNHPKQGDAVSFNQALCGLYAAGLGAPSDAAPEGPTEAATAPTPVVTQDRPAPPSTVATLPDDRYRELGHMLADFLDRSRSVWEGPAPAPAPATASQPVVESPSEPVVVTGAALGLPGTDRVFDDDNLGRILAGQQFIGLIPQSLREAVADKHITRLVKSEHGDPRFEAIDSSDDVIKLAARAGAFDPVEEFGIDADRDKALDDCTRLAIGAGFDALRDAGIPLVMRYKTTTVGTKLPERWGLPDALRDDTGVIFASAFPGYGELARDVERSVADRFRRDELAALRNVRSRLDGGEAAGEIDRRIGELEAAIEAEPFEFDRRFLFRILSMGHSQFAEIIGARGPNTQVNAACASTTQAIGLAEDWIRAGRCRRVVIVAADNVTSDSLLEWMGAGFLATGAAATDEAVEEAALPFDNRRHGMLLGMGAAGIVVESAEAARERGVQPVCEVLATVTANSAFHGTKLDVDHISGVMEDLVVRAEARGVDRHAIAPETVFVSHETYTPARGGSAQAEISALRSVFGDAADRLVIANTKGFTGHPMGVGIEDVVAIKALETGIVPPVPNFKELDPSLGALNLSIGGAYPVRYALRLAAGFGSQISMVLLRWTPVPDGVHRSPAELGYDYRIVDRPAWQRWLATVSGTDDARLEVVQRRLRVVDSGPATRREAPTTVAEPQPAPTVVEPQPAPTVVKPEHEPVREPEPATVEPEPAEREPAPVAAALEPEPAAAADLDVEAEVLTVVADKTGYPADMLDLDLDLEADLGIDTVKQAEVFAQIRERFGIERDDKLKLRDYPTLAHVIGFVRDRAGTGGAPAPAAVEPQPAEPAATPAAAPDLDVEAEVLGVVADKTGYPADMLDLDLDLEADLGIDTVKQAEVFALIRERFGIERDDKLKLRDYPTLAHVIGFVRDRAATEPTATGDDRQEYDPTTIPSSEPESAEPESAAAPDLDVEAEVLAVVADKTGYPADMLDLDLDLEADLGIDTVKQAEVFAQIRERFGIERDDKLKLRDYPTLAHVIGFVRDRAGAAGPPNASGVAHRQIPTLETPEPLTQPIADVTDADRMPRRVPVPTIRPPLDACAPTGVTLASGTRVVVGFDGGDVASALVERLTGRGVEVLAVDDRPGADDLAARLDGWLQAGPIHGVFWLAALDDEGPIGEMDLAAWREANRVRVKLLYATMRRLYDHVSAPGTFLLAATRLGGRHGYGEAGASAPLGGAVTGFAKAFARERPDALVKAVDVGPADGPDDVAEVLVAEALHDPGAVEVGHADGLRWTVTLDERPAAGEPGEGMALGPDTVFVVTGAAGSIVSAITQDLAGASGGIFHLLDLTPEPDPADPDVARFGTDKEGLKADLIERLRNAGERPTPVMVEKELARIERLAAAGAAIDAVRAAGGQAYYHSVDLTDEHAVAHVIGEVAVGDGRIDVLLHAAGLEISHSLPDKEPAEYDLVFGVKSDGWFNLVRAIGDLPLGTTVAFSSVAGRFGNIGQTDYSAANDLLCKLASAMRSTRPDTRAIVIDWTAWAGIGMASRGSIPKMMDLAGIEMLPPEVGVPTIRRELTAGAIRGEIVVAGSLGVMAEERAERGGIEPARFDTTTAGPMVGEVTAMGVHGGLVVETALDPAEQPFLGDHQIEGTPVLPGVMGIEAFAEVAGLPLPGWHPVEIQDVEFLAPCKFYRGEPRTLTITATYRPDGDQLVADCRLVGSRQLANQPEPQVTTHFTGRVRLARAPLANEVTAPGPSPDGTGATADAIYCVYFHGPAYQVLERAWRSDHGPVGLFATGLPDDHLPPERREVVSPRLIELFFQTAGIWEIGRHGRFGLPQHVGRIVLHPALDAPQGRVEALVEPGDAGFDGRVVDAAGSVLVELRGYRTVELPGGVDPERQAPLAEAMA